MGLVIVSFNSLIPDMNLFAFIGILVITCFLFQRLCRRSLDNSQYNYLRDILLIGAWMVSGIWSGDPEVTLIIGASVVAAVIGMYQHVYPQKKIRFLFLGLGVLFAAVGPRISFLGLPHGEYFYLSDFIAVFLTGLWLAVFPILIQELDNIPGMAGHLLAVSFSILLIATALSGQYLPDALFTSMTGLLLLGVFWSRHGHMYRRLGESLSAFWGVLVAGTSLLGVSKGITFSTLMVLPLGLFAIPLMETSLHFASSLLSANPKGAMVIYRSLIGRGLDHPSAVKFITSICALTGAIIAMFQLSEGKALVFFVSGIIIFAGVTLVPVFARLMKNRSVKGEKPDLWGVTIDNVSMNYAITKVYSLLSQKEGGVLISTVNSLAVQTALKDEEYRKIVAQSALTLADGTGLIWALRFLGKPVQERITGIDFLCQLCRTASVEGWPVYFLGSKPGVAQKAAENLKEQYPGLVIAGVQHGYFTEKEEEKVIKSICESGTQLLFVGLGIPRQEKWIYKNMKSLGNVVAIGIGGSFDVISGSLSRAPMLIQKMGLEWLYRLIQEPWRWKRDLELFTFVWRVLLTKIGIIRR
ncbi:WecB/TagA/CpsF family glycosyltransferase [Aminobacterium mobile]|uniref:WecB/TagA/CpsF family glycosyltransferase n=2 Tax=Aminobacteriaceae TaxID=3029087 RepID=UPI0004641324|nr:WecB/TagA/CpsF family glycosyltransferase [Aminobacterium mobile]